MRSARHAEGESSLAIRATLRLIRGTTRVARGMRALPMPKPGAEERFALDLASRQLRAMLEMAPIPADPAPGSPEEALVELIQETLALVDAMLVADPELSRPDAPKAALPQGSDGVVKVRF